MLHYFHHMLHFHHNVVLSPITPLSPHVITNHTNFTTCYHQSYHFHYMLSPITPISPHVIINHTTFTICYHQSSFLCLPYRRKLDVRSSQLLPAVLPVPLIRINTSTAWLSVKTTKPLLTVELLLHLQEIYIFIAFLQSISVLVHFLSIVVIFAP